MWYHLTLLKTGHDGLTSTYLSTYPGLAPGRRRQEDQESKVISHDMASSRSAWTTYNHLKTNLKPKEVGEAQYNQTTVIDILWNWK
ncbi:hypothetical protein I79_008288 [Cricetulus griseus]|uniref:Uncharacterized protein n=1 Tax=Cricetulus griseus TaxID=10029 RepID=G3HCS3_CRIGR|nr:hypothetical protein I79_008288 [Cricetulus griseus]